MTRGARKASAGAAGVKGIKLKPRKRTKKQQVKASDEEEEPEGVNPEKSKASMVRRTIKKKAHNVPEVKTAGEISPHDIRRTPEGRMVIQRLIDELHDMDLEVFPSSPVFDEQGKCRMKFEGATSFTLDRFRGACGEALESM